MDIEKIARKIVAFYDDGFRPEQIMPQGQLTNKFYTEFDSVYDYFNRRHKKMSKIHDECYNKLEQLKMQKSKLLNHYDPQNQEQIKQLEYKIKRFQDLNKHFQWVLDNINNALNFLNEIKDYE